MKIFFYTYLKVMFLLMLSQIFSNCKKGDYDDTGFILSSDKTEILANGTETVVFSVKDKRGNDMTEKAVFFRDGIQLSSKSFSSSVANTFKFYASIENVATNEVQIKVRPVIKHVKNILIEDYTGTWCGYCPRISKAVEEALLSSKRINVVAIHNDSEMMFSNLQTLTSHFSITGYPTAYIDRSFKWPYPENTSALNEVLSKPAYCGIGLETEIADNKGKVKVNIEFAGGYVNKTKIVVFVTEDNLRYNQVNFYPQYGSNPIINFRHDNVLRYSLTYALGEDIPETGPSGFSKEYQFEIGKYDKYNMNIVVIVTDSSTNECLNSKTIKLGSNSTAQSS